MPTYQAPGVYIEEIPSAPVILPVGTSTAAFIGTAPKADAFPATARAVNSWTQFVRDNLDTLKTVGRGKPADGDKKPTALRPRASTYGTLYFPQILARDPLSSDPKLVPVFPSGHMAGIWARSDATRGVHKAPANEVVRGAIDLTYQLTPAEQGGLNDSGVNCIRFFEREGIRVWGARTVAEIGNEFRYLNVRRLFNFIEQSIAQSTKWVVFEDNDVPLWRNLTRDVTAFLINVWRDNALVGTTPQQAFFVACNAATNPPESVDLGQVIVLIGLAPVKPAEFVVFRLSQKLGNVPEIQAVGKATMPDTTNASPGTRPNPYPGYNFLSKPPGCT